MPGPGCRDLPRLIDIVQGGSGGGGGGASARSGRAAAMNVQLSADETYADIVPVRQPDAHSAFVSIMRGCNNMVRARLRRIRGMQQHAHGQAGMGSQQALLAGSDAALQGFLAALQWPHCLPAILTTCVGCPPPAAVLLLHRALHPRPRAQPPPAINCGGGGSAAPAGSFPGREAFVQMITNHALVRVCAKRALNCLSASAAVHP